MRNLKPITAAGIPAALQRADRYRLLNDSAAAESICLDVLAVDPGNLEARTTRVLAITDQFLLEVSGSFARAREAVACLVDPYARAYYEGLVRERWAKALLRRGHPGASAMAGEWLEQALLWYAKAEALRPPGNDDAILRWNASVRMLESHQAICPVEDEAYQPAFE